jgi:poly(glycerol-phosphate) alpha-glucosyltransferase
MKLGIVTSSVSRNAGGIFDVIRLHALSLHKIYGVDLHVYGTDDSNTKNDMPSWHPIPVSVFPMIGPRNFGYTPRLLENLLSSGADILHTHGLWMYHSLASMEWHKKTRRPYVVSPHGMLDPWAVRNARWKKRLAGWLYEYAHLRGAACIHALCEAEAQAVRSYGLHNPI